MDILSLIGRDKELFKTDIAENEHRLAEAVRSSSFLVLGGAGSIGQAVVKELFKRDPKKLYVVDISENNLSELVRDLRSSIGYITGDFQTFAIDVGSEIYDKFFQKHGDVDYVLNLSALKHVRSEKDEFTLARMIEVNILNTNKTIKQCIAKGVRKYFCVSTDKATNPVNMMGASKRIMELFLSSYSKKIDISTARFANVAFSDGSLLHSFSQRIQKSQPIVAPDDVRRYFVTDKEGAELCLLSCIFGQKNDIFFPRLSDELHLISFADIAKNYLGSMKIAPHVCVAESEAREYAEKNTDKECWPCFWCKSDTTGEKDFEEFFSESETPDFSRFENIGIVSNEADIPDASLIKFEADVKNMISGNHSVDRQKLVNLFRELLPNFVHKETGKYLDGKM